MAATSGAAGGMESRSFGLDLVRAVAIGGVLAAHGTAVAARGFGSAGPLWAAWLGVLGVEIFFVLSGFLIGRLLIDIAGRRPSLRSWLVFMVRRWMRTVPLYAAWICVLLVFLPPEQDARTHMVQFLTLTQNLAWPLQDGWFNVSWSLAVEEWFYLLFSATFLAAAAVLGRRGQWLAVAAFLALPLLARLFVPSEAPWDAVMRKVVLLRLDAIAYGVAIAMVGASRPRLLRPWRALLAAGVGLNILVYLAFAGIIPCDPALVRPLSFSAMSVGIALCFPAALRVAERRGRSARAVRALSAQSYGLYLVHISVMEYLSSHSGWLRYHSVFLALATGALAWMVSWASFRFFEKPILDERPRQFQRPAENPRPTVPMGA